LIEKKRSKVNRKSQNPTLFAGMHENYPKVTIDHLKTHLKSSQINQNSAFVRECGQ
jgi:hypothetical protein